MHMRELLHLQMKHPKLHKREGWAQYITYIPLYSKVAGVPQVLKAAGKRLDPAAHPKRKRKAPPPQLGPGGEALGTPQSFQNHPAQLPPPPKRARAAAEPRGA